MDSLLCFFSFLAGCWFVQVMKKFAFRDWCLEQRFMALLLPLVLLYNNPLFPMTFLIPSWLPGTLDGFFQVCISVNPKPSFKSISPYIGKLINQ